MQMEVDNGAALSVISNRTYQNHCADRKVDSHWTRSVA